MAGRRFPQLVRSRRWARIARALSEMAPALCPAGNSKRQNVSALLTPPIVERHRQCTANAGREPSPANLEALRRLVLTEWSQVMHQIRRVER